MKFLVKFLTNIINRLYMKLILLCTLIFLFTACNNGESKEKQKEIKIGNSKEVQLKNIDAQKEQELAKIASQTTLAKLKKEQLLAQIKLNAKAQKEKLLLEQAKEKTAFEAKLREREHQDAMEIKRYIFFLLFFILVMISYFIYLYFKHRHDDKLRAYQDNLDKYFHQQENLAKMKIAEKIIDTVASGKLAKEQEKELIKALNGTMNQQQEPPMLSNLEDEISLIEKDQKS